MPKESTLPSWQLMIFGCKDKLEHQVEVMEALPEKVGVLYSNAMQIDEAGAEIGFVEEHTTFGLLRVTSSQCSRTEIVSLP